jgi:hypothetical protein
LVVQGSIDRSATSALRRRLLAGNRNIGEPDEIADLFEQLLLEAAE